MYWQSVSPQTVSIGDGFRFGIGFMTAAVVFGLLWLVLVSLLFGSLLSALAHL